MENNPNCVDFSKNQSFGIQQLTRLREDKCYLEYKMIAVLLQVNILFLIIMIIAYVSYCFKELSLQQPAT